MKKLIKQTVYLPVKEGVLSVSHWDKDNHIQDVESVYGYFFTSEQLNEYTAHVIRQALKTAADKADLIETDGDVDPKSITNTFDETFNKFKI